MHRLWIVIAIFSSLQTCIYSYSNHKPCKLTGSGSAQYPGVVLRLTTNGIDNLKRIMTNVMNAEIPLFRLPLVKSGSVLGVSYDVTDLQIDYYTPPTQLYLNWIPNSATQLRLQGDGLNVQLAAFLSTSSILLRSQTLVFNLDNIGFTVGFAIVMNTARRASVQITECEFHYGYIGVRREDLAGSAILSGIVNSVVEKKLKRFFNGPICDMLQSQGSLSLSQWIGQLPSEISVFQPPAPSRGPFPRLKRASMRFHNFQPEKLASDLLNIAEKLYLDMHIKNNPQVGQSGTSKFLDIPINGEVRLRHLPSAPFNPKRFPPVRGNQYHHLYILISDFTLNSMLYHMYASGLMNIIVEGSKSPPEISDFLQSNCDNGVCIGTLLPGTFRNQKRQFLQMRIYPSHCPFVTISKSKGIVMDMGLTIELYSQPPARKMLYSNKLQSRGQLTLKSKFETITGNYKVLDIRLEKVSRENEAVMDFVMAIATTAVEVKVDELLNPGLRIPPLGVGTLKNLALTTDENVIILGVNIVLNNTGLRSAVHNMIQNKIYSSSSYASYDYY